MVRHFGHDFIQSQYEQGSQLEGLNPVNGFAVR